MPSQAQREQFLWRPSDNSVETNHRYDREAEKWYLSYQSAKRKHTRRPLQGAVGVIGLLLSLAYNIIWMIVILVKRLYSPISK